jgi:molybdopterin converting factor small subunit
MKIVVRLYANLAKKEPPGALANLSPEGFRAGAPIEVELQDGATVADLASRLGLAGRDVHAAFVNGKSRPLDHSLADADQVGIFPPIGGG